MLSHLSSLAEFNIRPELKVQKGYLNGRFGAIPFLGDPCQLGLTDKDVKQHDTAEKKMAVK